MSKLITHEELHTYLCEMQEGSEKGCVSKKIVDYVMYLLDTIETLAKLI